MKKLAAILGTILILSSFLFPLASCKTEPARAGNLMIGIKPNTINASVDISEDSLAAIDFAVRLFQRSVSSEENSLISPLSVLCALAMVTNGTDGNTRAQIENVLGFSVTDLNNYVYVLPPKIGPISKLDLAMIKQQPWTTFFASHPTPV